MRKQVTSGCSSLTPHWIAADYCWALYDDRTLTVAVIGGGDRVYRLTPDQYGRVLAAHDEDAAVQSVLNDLREKAYEARP